MADPELDVALVVRDLIDAEWLGTVTKPETIRLRTEDETGEATKGVSASVGEYILVSETQERSEEWACGRNVLNFDAACFVEFATNESRARREEVYRELRRIARRNRDRREAASHGATLGEWDTLDVSTTVTDDETFGFWAFNQTWQFGAELRTPSYG